jgi:hypothetical protein
VKIMKAIESLLFLTASLLVSQIIPVQVMNGQSTAQVQVNPDCPVLAISLTLTAGSPATLTLPGGSGFDNRSLGCQSYVLEYVATATSGTITGITFQAAGGATVPGTFGAWGGTVSTGVNPNTSNTRAITTFTTGCVASTPCTVANSWLNIVVARNNFVGTIQLSVYGWKQGAGGAAGSGGGGGGGCTAPCVVEGTAAAGSAPSGAPVQVGGSDGTNMRTLKTDNTGALIIAGTTTTSCDPSLTSTVPITLTSGAGGVTLLVAASAGKVITVCHISLSFATGQNFNLQQGTGSTCSGSTALATGIYQSISGIALDVPFDITTSNGLCVLASNATDAGGGLLVYVQK